MSIHAGFTIGRLWVSLTIGPTHRLHVLRWSGEFEIAALVFKLNGMWL